MCKYQLRKAFEEAKKQLGDHFGSSSNPRKIWKGLRAFTEKVRASPVGGVAAPLADYFNTFYSRFEVSNPTLQKC